MDCGGNLEDSQEERQDNMAFSLTLQKVSGCKSDDPMWSSGCPEDMSWLLSEE